MMEQWDGVCEKVRTNMVRQEQKVRFLSAPICFQKINFYRKKKKKYKNSCLIARLCFNAK